MQLPCCSLVLLAFWSAAAARAEKIEVPAAVLEDKIRGGLLGQILGDLNGLKHEMKYIAQPGNVEQYSPELPEGAWTDDDTDVEWVYLLEMERSNTVLLPPSRIADLWRKHINRRIWCSNQYLRQLIDLGIEPPLTGHSQFNPWADFNLSGQFLSETWGLVSPGLPQTAARIGVHYTRVGIDLEPAQSTQLFAAMIASAFLTNDLERILDAGVAAADPASTMRRIVADARRWRRENPADWRATRRLIQQKYARYGGNDMRDRNGVLLNGAAAISALLYGRGDFVETLRLAFNFGWDCDNNAATAGAIIGVIQGNRWMLDQGWKIADRFRNTSRDEMPADETITKFGDRLVAVAGRVIAEHGGARTVSNGRPVYQIETEKPRNVLPLEDPAAQTAKLRSELSGEIESALAKPGTAREQARAAYLAVCLDLAPALRAKYPEQWAGALESLRGYPKLLQVLFFQSPIPAGDKLREKALASGIEKPARKENLW